MQFGKLLTKNRVFVKHYKDTPDSIISFQVNNCFQANQLNQINITPAGTLADVGGPSMQEFNSLVGVVNTIIGSLNLLPNGACSNI